MSVLHTDFSELELRVLAHVQQTSGSGSQHAEKCMAGLRRPPEAPNLQNIPICTDAGRRVRKAFAVYDTYSLRGTK